MRYLHLILILFLIANSHSLSAQTFLFNQSTYEDEFIVDVCEDSFNQFYLFGNIGNYATNVDAMNYDIICIKINSNGDTIRTKRINTTNNFTWISKAFILGDTVIALTGNIRLPNNEYQSVIITCDTTFNNINITDIGILGTNEFVQGSSLSRDGNLLIIGNAVDPMNIDYQVFYYKIDLLGNSLHSGYYGFPTNSEFSYSIIELPDTSGCLMFVYNWPIPKQTICNDVLKINYNTNTIDTAFSIYQTKILLNTTLLSDNKFLVSGNLDAFGNTVLLETQNYLKVYDFQLNLIDSLVYGVTDTNDRYGWNATYVNNSDDIIIGTTFNFEDPPTYFGNQSNGIVIYRFDSLLNMKWEKRFSYGNNYLTLISIIRTNDGGFLFAGMYYDYLNTISLERNIFAIKTDSLGNIFTNLQEIDPSTNDILVYPNPFHDIINIEMKYPDTYSSIEIYDSYGKLCYTSYLSETSSQLNIEHFTNGLYYYVLRKSNGKLIKGKLIKN